MMSKTEARLKDEDDKEVNNNVPTFDGENIDRLLRMVYKALKLAMDYKWFLHHNVSKKMHLQLLNVLLVE